MNKIEEGYGLGISIDPDKRQSCISIIKKLPNGEVKIVNQIFGEKAERLYDELIINKEGEER